MKNNNRHKFPYSSIELAEKVNSILDEYEVPLTLRQIYYRLVAIGLKNAENVYKNFDAKLSRLRENGLVPWDKITEIGRQLKKDPSWTSPEAFFEDVSRAYKRDLQQGQPKYIEIWCEKAVAISHIARKYDINLCAGGGYRSGTSLYEAAERFKYAGKPAVILYLGDFDPSGLDIERDMNRLRTIFGVEVDIQRVLLLRQDITDYSLKPNCPVKHTDTRTLEYMSKYGLENGYELDALPPNVLAEKLEAAIRRNMDVELYETQLAQLDVDNAEIDKFIENWQKNVSKRLD